MTPTTLPLGRLVPLLGLAIACAGLLAAPPARGDRLPDDPVEKFKQALMLEYNKSEGYKRDLRGKSLDLAVSFRQKNLTDAARDLKSLGDLSLALLLEWPVAPKSKQELDSESEFDRKSRAIEAKVRAGLTERFVAGVQKALRTGQPGRQVAVANLVSETAASASDLPDERLVLFEGLAPLADDLAKLTRSGNARVSAAAARALGQFPAKPDVVAGAMKDLLSGANTPLIAREAAADALVSLVQVVSTSQQVRPSEPGVGTPAALRPKTFLGLDTLGSVTAAVTPAAAAGLDDANVGVRRRSAQALRQAAATLAFETRLLLPLSRRDDPDPPTERPWSADERKNAAERRQDTAAKTAKLRPAFLAMSRQSAALLKAAQNSDPTVRQEARRTLEALAQARSILSQLKEGPPPLKPGDKGAARPARRGAILPVRAESADGAPRPLRLPAPGGGAVQDEKKKREKDAPREDDSDELLAQLLRSVAQGLASSGFADPRAASRRAAYEALESSGDIAKQFIPQLITGLSDKDLFVRWIAARALGRLAPASADTVVPALVKRLSDDDLDVRGAAARALGQYGPAAREAVPALGAIAEKGDAELRLIVLKSLEDIGTASAAALPNLGRALGDLDPRIRERAARLIGRFGPKARAYAPALQRLTGDPDPRVRREASAALLEVEDE